MPNINSLLARSMIACYKGLNKPVPQLNPDDETPCKSQVYTAIKDFPDWDKKTYETVKQLIGLSTNLLNQKLFEDSRKAILQAIEVLNKSHCSKWVRLWCEAEITRAKSEFFFQTKDYTGVQVCIEEFPWPDKGGDLAFFHIGFLRLLLLLIRSCAEKGEDTRAMDLVQEAVAYLCGHIKRLSISKTLYRDITDGIPEVTRQELVAQFAGEAGFVLTKHQGDQAADLFARFTAWKWFASDKALKEIYDWGRMKEAFLEGDYEAFLTQCAPFLQSGRRETLLWDTTVLDLCHCCRLLKPHQTAEFLEQVAENAQKMNDIPPGGYALPTGIYYKRIFVVKGGSYPAFVLPTELRQRLENISDCSGRKSGGKTLYTRRFHAYNVGLPRSGCSSIMALFSDYRSVAEYKERESVELITAWKDGWITEKTLHHYILYRHEMGALEMDTASFNHFYLHILTKEFPEAKFIFTVRDCYTWVNSFLRMISRWRMHFSNIGQPMPEWMLNYGRILFGDYDWDWFNSYQALREHLDPLLELFVKSWASLNRRILDLLPPNRSILVRTSDISRSQSRLADFIGIPVDTLTEHHHINRAPDEVNLLAEYDRSQFDALCYRYGKDVMDRVKSFS